MSYNWKIAACNVRGMNYPAKQQDILEWYNTQQHTITCISETRLNQQTATFLKYQNSQTTFIHTSDPQDINGSGTGIIINRNLTPHIHSINEVPGRCITIQLKFKYKTDVTISSIYGKANQDKKTARDITKHLLKHHQHSKYSIITGDFNENLQQPKIILK